MRHCAEVHNLPGSLCLKDCNTTRCLANPSVHIQTECQITPSQLTESAFRSGDCKRMRTSLQAFLQKQVEGINV